jgi:hypothetical protein
VTREAAPRTSRLADRLTAARRRSFVGREPEIELFRTAIASAELPFQVLYVHGPGGVGKTSLLREFGQCCADEGLAYAYVDGRDVEPTTEAFGRALHGACDDVEADGPTRVVVVDTYETLISLDGWLRDNERSS